MKTLFAAAVISSIAFPTLTSMAATTTATAPATTTSKPAETNPATKVGADTKGRHPVPDAAAVAKANKLLNDTLGEQLIRTRTTEQKLDVAPRLVTVSRTQKDFDSRYALLTRARDLAIETVDVTTIASAIDQLNLSFDVDGIKLESEALAAASKFATKPELITAFEKGAKRFVEKAMNADRYDAARSLAQTALATAQRGGDQAQIKEWTAVVELTRQAETAYKDYKQAVDVLATNPEDPAANLKVGIYKCFRKENWAEGLANLAKGSDPALAAAAKKDLQAIASNTGNTGNTKENTGKENAANENIAKDKVNAGDTWSDYANTTSGFTKDAATRRAQMYYKDALLGGLGAGLDKLKIEQRLKDFEDFLGSDDKPSPVNIPQIEEEFVTKMLGAVPKEMFPLGSDNEAVVKEKVRAIEKYIKENKLAEGSGFFTARFVNKQLNGWFEMSNGQRLESYNLVFSEQLNINGFPCFVSLSSPLKEAEADKTLAKSLQMLRLNDPTLYRVSAKVKSMSMGIGPIQGNWTLAIRFELSMTALSR